MSILSNDHILYPLSSYFFFRAPTFKTMAALETGLSVCSVCSVSSSSTKTITSRKPLFDSLKLNTPSYVPLLSHNSLFSPYVPILYGPTRKICFKICSVVQEIEVEETPQQTKVSNPKRKLYVVNLPWSLTVADIKSLFDHCGIVTDVEIIKQKDGKNRGFAFVTMASAEEAQTVIDKLNLHEVSGRIIKVDYAKRFKKPSPPLPPGPRPGETRHKLYVSNLQWKVRSSHLREFFSTEYNPVSARVVFDGTSGKSAGYGFVSFATREEAESALSSLDGKELKGRELRLKFSEKNDDQLETEKEELEADAGTSEGQYE